MDWTKFSKVLGMLGSAHQGEQLAALDRANKMLSAESMTWDDLVKSRADGQAAQDALVEAQGQAKYFEGLANQYLEEAKKLNQQIERLKFPKPDDHLTADDLKKMWGAFNVSPGGGGSGGGSGSMGVGGRGGGAGGHSYQYTPKPPQPQDAGDTLTQIDEMLDYIKQYISRGASGTENFLLSVQSYYNRTGKISVAQEAAVAKVYQDYINRQGAFR